MIKILINNMGDFFKRYDDIEKDLVDYYENSKFIFNECKLIFNDDDRLTNEIIMMEDETYFKIKWCNKRIKADCEFEIIEGEEIKLRNVIASVSYRSLIKEGLKKSKAKKLLENFASIAYYEYMKAKAIILYELNNRNKIIKESKNKSRNCNKSSKKVYEKKEIYLYDELIEYISHSNIKHNIKCEAWTVRGHYRHYKSGKVVFIESFKKGKNRNNDIKEDKTYII